MKRLIGIICVVLAMTMAMTAISFAATADIVNESVEGTATVDGTKDEAYDAATALEFVQKGSSNGGSKVLDDPIGRAYIINDTEWVYVWFEVYDDNLDQGSANTYEQDSVEFFWMDNNSKYQLRVRYDGSISADTGSDWADKGAEFVAVETDNGFAVEAKFPITDVKDNQIEMTLQINACTDGSRDYTCYILGNDDADNAYQRTSRDTDYDVWWTLTLAGEFEDTRVETADLPMELTASNYAEVQAVPFHVQGYMQDHVNWSWNSAGTYTTGVLGDTLEISWDYDAYSFEGYLSSDNTAEWTSNPTFAISVGDGGYLQLPDGAEVGDTGDSARYSFTYSDITITATGYDNVVISGGTIDATRFTIKQESGYTSGTSKDIDLLSGILEQTGLTLEQFATDYLPNVTNISFDITFDAYELVTVADIEAFLVELDAEDEEVLASLQEYIDRVDAAEEIVNSEESTLEEKEDALDDAKKAANRATKASENYPKATEAADELQERVATMTATVEALQAEATADEEVVEDEDTSADTSSSSSSDSSSSTGVVVGIIIVIVVIVVVVVVVVVTGKKKKK
ncbi:MAG: hypothetical protein LUH03_10290 [Oscillospiraceae bacterium]|nr:hypothetical protein [Oscillospiraceae bacterium]